MATKLYKWGLPDVNITFQTDYEVDDTHACLAVIGSIPELGSWHEDRCLLAFEVPKGSRRWSAKIYMYAQTSFSWKWVVVTSDMTRAIRWEDINDRQQKIENTYESIVIKAPWNAPATVLSQTVRTHTSKISVELSKAVGNAHFVGSAEGDLGLLGKPAFVDIVKKLENIPISRAAILKCQEAIEDHAVEKWNEKVQVMEQRVVKGNMIEEYLKYMKDKYPGMDNGLLEKYKSMLFGPWATYTNEFKQNHNNTRTSYGQVNFGKSDDETEYACIYAYCTADIKFAEQTVKKNEHPILWGLINIKSFEKKPRDLPQEVVEAVHNYFRYRALDGFLNTGVIFKINWVA